MSQPLISIICTAFLPKSRPYLDLCMQSIANLEYKHTETIIVSPRSYAPQYTGAVTVSPSTEDYGNPLALNLGAMAARGDMLLFINDDVILTKGCLEHLAALASHPNIGPVMPIGNDQQNLYSLSVGFPSEKAGGINLIDPGPLKIERVRPYVDRMMQAASLYPGGALFYPHLCLYAFMIERKKWQALAGFDESFNLGYDDTDFCMRVRQNGMLSAIALGSVIWHFGGVSADQTQSTDKRDAAKAIFERKWGGM